MRSREGMGVLLSLRTVCRNGAVWLLLALAVVQLAGCTRPLWLHRPHANFRFTPPYLGPDDFQGSFSPRLSDANNGLQSTYSGLVAVTSVHRATVQQMLPPGLFLATPHPNTWGGSLHPVVHMIGEQRAPSTLFAGAVLPVLGAPGYDEMIMFVPFVVKANGTLWHNYVVRMYLNHIIPVFGGNELFGYQKVLARLDQSQQGSFVRHTVTSEDLATTWFRDDVDLPAGQPSPAGAAALPRWDEVRKILEMPFLGVRPDEVMVCSYWELDYSNATVAPTASRHQVVTKFRDGMEPWETMGTLRSARNGAFSMSQVRWRLAWPWLVQGC